MVNVLSKHFFAFCRSFMAIGGGNLGGTHQLLDKFDTYNIDTNSWTVTSTLPDLNTHRYPLGRAAFGCTQYEHYLIIGGGRNYSAVHSQALDDVWILDLVTSRWRCLPLRLPMTFFFHTLTVSATGTLYLFGGVNDDRRYGVLYEAPLCMQKLAELCWKTFTKHVRNLHKLKRTDLLARGVPREYVNRLPSVELHRGLSCSPS